MYYWSRGVGNYAAVFWGKFYLWTSHQLCMSLTAAWSQLSIEWRLDTNLVINLHNTCL